MSRKTKYNIGLGLDAGRQRRGNPNQDAVGMVLPGFLNPRPPLYVLADGMGGHKGGALASQTVVEVVSKRYLAHKEIDPPKVVPILIKEAHQAIKKIAGESPELAKMGSTIAMGIVKGGKFFYGNVGDSRIYLINSSEVKQLSVDHSFVADQVKRRVITPAEAMTHPHRNRLTQSISAGRDELEPYLDSCELTPDDILVFCSDGLWGTITEAQIQSVVLELQPQKAADKLVDMANASLGPDNISVIVIRDKGFSHSVHENDL